MAVDTLDFHRSAVDHEDSILHLGCLEADVGAHGFHHLAGSIEQIHQQSVEIGRFGAPLVDSRKRCIEECIVGGSLFILGHELTGSIVDGIFHLGRSALHFR